MIDRINGAMSVGTAIEMRAIAESGDFVMVLETWRSFRPADLPICMLPRGAPPPNPFQRAVPMYRAEAIEKGLLKVKA